MTADAAEEDAAEGPVGAEAEGNDGMGSRDGTLLGMILWLVFVALCVLLACEHLPLASGTVLLLAEGLLALWVSSNPAVVDRLVVRARHSIDVIECNHPHNPDKDHQP